jgi:hypothetical protein
LDFFFESSSSGVLGKGLSLTFSNGEFDELFDIDVFVFDVMDMDVETDELVEFVEKLLIDLLITKEGY